MFKNEQDALDALQIESDKIQIARLAAGVDTTDSPHHQALLGNIVQCKLESQRIDAEASGKIALALKNHSQAKQSISDAIDMWTGHLQQMTALHNPQKYRRKMAYANMKVQELKVLATAIHWHALATVSETEANWAMRNGRYAEAEIFAQEAFSLYVSYKKYAEEYDTGFRNEFACEAGATIKSIHNTDMVAEIMQSGGFVDLDSDMLRTKELLSVIQLKVSISNVRARLYRHGLDFDCSRQILHAALPRN